MLAEFAASADGGDQAQWLADMNAELQSGAYPDL